MGTLQVVLINPTPDSETTSHDLIAVLVKRRFLVQSDGDLKASKIVAFQICRQDLLICFEVRSPPRDLRGR